MIRSQLKRKYTYTDEFRLLEEKRHKKSKLQFCRSFLLCDPQTDGLVPTVICIS